MPQILHALQQQQAGGCDFDGGRRRCFRLAPDLGTSSDKQDYFVAADWRALDERDDDGWHPRCVCAHANLLAGSQFTLATRRRLRIEFFAGADLVLAPACFEPCGLTPIYAMHYGALPMVRRVGGLVNSVVDGGAGKTSVEGATGFAFDAPTLSAMVECCDRALAAYRRPRLWQAMQLRAISRDSGWETPARQYLALYR